MNDSTTINCLICGIEVLKNKHSRKFCSEGCIRIYHKRKYHLNKDMYKNRNNTTDGSPCIGCILDSDCRISCFEYRKYANVQSKTRRISNEIN